MSYKHEVNRGSMFKNRVKERESSPDYSGVINIDGVLYFIDSWISEGKAGKFLSLKVKKRNKQEDAEQPDEILDMDKDLILEEDVVM